MSRFGIQAFALNNIQYGGVSGFQFDAGSEVDTGALDGLQYETMHHETALKPMAEITTRNLKAVITALNGSTDLPQLAFDTTNGLLLVGGKSASGTPGYAGGSVHYGRRALRGLIYMAGVSWSLGGKAETTLKAVIKGDGTGIDVPVAKTLVALPTPPTPDFGFTLSALTINGVSIPSPNSVNISIEPNYEHEYLGGLPVPTDITGAGARKEMSITMTVDTGDVDIGEGTGVCSAVFKRYAQGGGLGTDTVTFTFNSRWSSEQNSGGGTNSPMSKSLLIRTRWDGTTKPLTWATA